MAEAVNLLTGMINQMENKTEEKSELAAGFAKQTSLTLVTKVDDNKVNKSNIPQLGLGTWRSPAGKVENAVEYALKIGYRLIDCAAIYRNENEVGNGIKNALSKGYCKREDIFVISKLWNTEHATENVVPALKQTLKALGLKKLDLYLIHWPMNFAKGDNLIPFNPETMKMDFGKFVPLTETWKGMEECVRLGLTDHIGISNFNEKQHNEIVTNCKISPTVSQNECHPYLTQTDLMELCKKNNIKFQCYSPLGNPGRPEGWDHSLPPVMKNDVITNIAKKLNVSVASVCIKFQIQRGNIVIPKSVTPSRIKSNFEVWDFELSDSDIKDIVALNKNIRYGIPTVVDKNGKRFIRDAAHPNYPWDKEYKEYKD